MKLSKRVSLILISTLLFTFNSNLHITTYGAEVNCYNTSQQVAFKINDQWDGAFIGEIVLTNTSDTPLSNWKLQFTLPHNITSIWNAKISHDSNLYTLECEYYNSTIYPNQIISIGFIANYNTDITLPEDYILKSSGEIIDCPLK